MMTFAMEPNQSPIIFDFLLRNGPNIGPILSGIALSIAAITGIITLLKIGNRQIADAWGDRFRTLYGEFWKEPEMREVRCWLANKTDYEALSALLTKRKKAAECDVSAHEYIMLDKLDRFCSLLVRLKAFKSENMTSKQRKLLDNVLFEYWIDITANREEVKNYILENWTELKDEILTRTRKGKAGQIY